MERDSLWKKVRETATHQIVDVEMFSREYDVSLDGIEGLARTSQDSRSDPKDLEFETSPVNRRYLVNPIYRRELENHLENSMTTGQEKSSTVTFHSHDLPGNPPVWYIDEAVQRRLKHLAPVNSSWKINSTPEKVECIPRDAIRLERDKIIASLNEGLIPFLDMLRLIELFPDIYHTVADVEQYFANFAASNDVSVISRIVLSNPWLNNHTNLVVKLIQERGYADLNVSLEYAPSRTCLLMVQNRLKYWTNFLKLTR